MAVGGPTHKARSRRPWGWIAAGLGALLLAGLVVLWIKVPDLYGSGAAATTATGTTRAGILTAAAALIAATAAGAGLYFTQLTVMETRRANRATDRRDRYAKAIEQLGHDKAPVRLGSMYSLELLAQDNLELRQAVVDVLCAYLRMPFAPPEPYERTNVSQAEDTEARTDATDRDPGRASAQELLVRETAQRLLADHLIPPNGISGKDAQALDAAPEEDFWPRIVLDLATASLVDFDLGGCSVGAASFKRTTFFGRARFDKATFFLDVSFAAATFSGDASFDGVTFSGDARFSGVTFSEDAWFEENATFDRVAWFWQAIFCKNAYFKNATFSGDAMFAGAKFSTETLSSGAASFGGVTFAGEANFSGATFFGDARFSDKVTFSQTASFLRTTFSQIAFFKEATFSGDVWFTEATFSGHVYFPSKAGNASFDDVHVLHIDHRIPEFGREWPHGWTLCPDPDDPARGTLVQQSSGP